MENAFAMKYLLFFLLVLPLSLAIGCTEYKINERMYIQIINSTNGVPITGQSCTYTFYDTSYSPLSSLSGISLTETSNGIYFWILNSSFNANTTYIVTASCTGGFVSSATFCTVVNYSYEIAGCNLDITVNETSYNITLNQTNSTLNYTYNYSMDFPKEDLEVLGRRLSYYDRVYERYGGTTELFGYSIPVPPSVVVIGLFVFGICGAFGFWSGEKILKRLMK